MTATIAAVSDLHGYLPAVPAADLLLLAGDICPDFSPTEQAEWLDGKFRRWLSALPMPVVAIWGNHDFVGQQSALVPHDLPWTLLSEAETVACGVRIYGSAYSPRIGSWAFMEVESALQRRWQRIPYGLDVLLVHGPPRGMCDRVVSGAHVGSPSLMERVRETAPPLVVCGHIHEAAGCSTFGGTTVWNVSHVDEHYHPKRPATIVSEPRAA